MYILNITVLLSFNSKVLVKESLLLPQQTGIASKLH